MMSKTHIAVGATAALAISETGSVESCVAALIGGTLGGIIADCDITPSRAHKDALIGRLIVVAIAVVALAVDWWAGGGADAVAAQIAGIGAGGGASADPFAVAGALAESGAAVDFSNGVCAYLVTHLGWPLIAGIAAFAALTFIGGRTAHRSFAHSLIASVAFAGAMYLICPPLLPFFAVGLVSHLVLDVTNKQPVRLLWPMRSGVALGLCDAKGAANAALMVLGIAAAAILLAFKLAPLFGIGIILR